MGWSDQDAARKADDVLKILAQQRVGLVVRRGDRYEFIHPSFREYLAAAALVRACDSDLEKVWGRIISHWREKNCREVALFVLGVLSDKDNDVTPLLERIWNEGKGDLYFVVAALADQVCVADDLANRVINSLLTLARGDVAAIDALYQLGRADDLLTLMCDKTVDTRMRQAAAQSLWHLEPTTDETDSILLRLAHDETENSRVRAWAATILEQTDEADSILLTLVRDEAKKPWEWHDVVATLLLTKRVDALLTLARDETLDAGPRVLAAVDLALLGRFDDLLTLARDYTVNSYVRWGAAIGLGMYGDARLLPDLERIAQQDADEHVRRAAREAVEAFRQRLSGK